MWGTSALGIAGHTNFFLTDDGGQTYVDFVFQMVFAGTAATIVAGAVAERTKTQSYLAYSFMIGAIIYSTTVTGSEEEDGWAHWTKSTCRRQRIMRVAA